MMKTADLIRNYIENKHYKVLDEVEQHTIFRYQLNTIHAIADENDEHFCTLLFPNFDEVNEDNMLDVVIRCNKLSADLKFVKVYVAGDHILISVEFYYQDENDFDFHMKHALYAIVAARAKYNELKDEAV